MSKTMTKEKPAKTVKSVSHEELEVAAYYHWQNRGCPSGDALTDWVEAQKKLAPRPFHSAARK